MKSITKYFSRIIKATKPSNRMNLNQEDLFNSIISKYNNDNTHRIALSIELLNSIETESYFYKSTISNILNKLIIENNYTFNTDTFNNIYLSRDFPNYKTISVFRPLLIRENKALIDELEDDEDKEETITFKNEAYETGGEFHQRDQTEWFHDGSEINKQKKINEIAIDSREHYIDHYICSNNNILHFELVSFSTQVVCSHISVYNNMKFSEVMQHKKLQNSKELAYRLIFDSLNVNLQNKFLTLLDEMDILLNIKIARYLAINREHYNYIKFLNNSINVLI